MSTVEQPPTQDHLKRRSRSSHIALRVCQITFARTRKITRAVTRIREGLQDKLYLGNLSAKRDWGYAKEYVEAMWLMLQQDEPEDFVIATGETQSVQEILEASFKHVGLPWKSYVETDPRFLRPAEVELLLGDATKAKEKLGWSPQTSFEGLVQIMTDSDWQTARQEAITKRHAA